MKKIILFVLILLSIAGSSTGQEKKSKKELKEEQAAKIEKIIEAQDYKFVAQRVFPMSGKPINLTSEYDLQVSNDTTVTAYLPYFGRAYTAPMDPTESGIKFKSKDFDYKIENDKKGGWIISITTKDTKQRVDMVLSVTTSGSAMLSVNDETRQSISFNGYIDELKKK